VRIRVKYHASKVERMENMKVQSTRRVLQGICNFCKSEIDKGRMTQHLKYCKQRTASIAAEVEETTEQKTQLFHLIVEGRYNPQYWMHLEVPASESLGTLDGFLRNIWLECCGHLSQFKIGDISYSSEPENFYFGEFEVLEEGEGAEEEGEEEEDEEEEGEFNGVVDGEELLAEIPAEFLEHIPSDVLSELRKSWPADDLVAFLKEKLQSIQKGGVPRTPEEWEEFRGRHFYRELLEWLLEMVEDRSMGVQLGKVLKVGQKFSYEYDFGSTTHLNLRVVSEREGVVRDEEEPVEILARNIAPMILCKVCGKPATKVASGYYDAEESGYCNKCARKSKNYEMMLPVVNSPRVGVCGYTGRG
jgi:hypothetical protein